MPTLTPESAEAKEINAALRAWRQGDLALEEQWFIHVGDPGRPLTPASADAVEPGLQALTSEAPGLAMITQTCDVVRTCVTRPYVEIAPLVRVDAAALLEIERGRRPALTTLPTLRESRLAVDLDRVMTVEKSVVATWKRTPGYTCDAEGRRFAQALARKRARFAFPDEFTALSRKLSDRLADKHGKATDEGLALRALREIRVHAAPAWNADSVALWFWFIRDDSDTASESKAWDVLLKAWLALVPKSGRFVEIGGQVVTLEEMSAADHVGSEPFDLDHLSRVDPSHRPARST